MIHDLDIVLSLAKSTVVDVAGPGHLRAGRSRRHGDRTADIRQRLRGQSSASRVSFQQKRTMSIFTSRGSASINFATHEATVVKPSEEVLRREFRADNSRRRTGVLERARVRSVARAYRSAMHSRSTPFKKSSATLWRPFAPASRRVSTARPAATRSRSAEMILERIEEHAWDGTSTGRRGPFAMPALPIIAGTTAPAAEPQERRRAVRRYPTHQ